MILDHERLDVSRLALDFLVFAHQVIEALPRGRSHLCDQLTRASTSIVLNIAEGAGTHSKADKRRYYLSRLSESCSARSSVGSLVRKWSTVTINGRSVVGPLGYRAPIFLEYAQAVCALVVDRMLGAGSALRNRGNV